MATRTFNGWADALWDTAENWDDGVLPEPGDDIVVGDIPPITGPGQPLTIGSLTVAGATGALDLANLTVAGTTWIDHSPGALGDLGIALRNCRFAGPVYLGHGSVPDWLAGGSAVYHVSGGTFDGPLFVRSSSGVDFFSVHGDGRVGLHYRLSEVTVHGDAAISGTIESGTFGGGTTLHGYFDSPDGVSLSDRTTVHGGTFLGPVTTAPPPSGQNRVEIAGGTFHHWPTSSGGQRLVIRGGTFVDPTITHDERVEIEGATITGTATCTGAVLTSRRAPLVLDGATVRLSGPLGISKGSYGISTSGLSVVATAPAARLAAAGISIPFHNPFDRLVQLGTGTFRRR